MSGSTAADAGRQGPPQSTSAASRLTIAMPSAHDFLGNLALVLCVAALAAVLFHRLKLPVVFGYLLAGMLVGPYIPVPLVADETMVRTLSELGVILLMYSLGLEFSVRRVVQIGASAGFAALAETSLMFGLGYAVAGLLGWTPREQLFTAAMVAISSTTIIAKTFSDQGVQGKIRDIVFGVLIIEDLIAVLLIAVLSTVAAGGDTSAGALGFAGVRLATFLVALIAVGLLVLPRLMRYVIGLGRAEVTTIASIGICFAAALLALAFGYSVALGAFIAGSLVAESGHGEMVAKLIEPVRDVFVAIFFVSVGMLIDPSVLVEHWGAVLVLTAAVIVGKVVAVSAGTFLTGQGLRDSVRAGMSLAQIGEFSFIIAGVGLASGSTRPFLYATAVAVSAITTLTTPWFIRAAEPMAHFVDRELPHSLQTYVALYGSWIEGLRSATPDTGGKQRIRRLVRLVLLDAALLAALIVAAAAEMGRLALLLQTSLGLGDAMSRWVVIDIAVVAAVPLMVGFSRLSGQLATALAIRAIPPAARRGLDHGAAPRRALSVTLHSAVLLAAAVPLLATLQAFVPRFPVLAALALLSIAIGIAVWRSARTLYWHANAGAEVISMALTQHDHVHGSSAELTETMEHVAVFLPGLGTPEPVRLTRGSPAIGQSLRELDLRARSGATVLAITRPGAPVAEGLQPSGRESLREGDVLALAGTHEAIQAARELLEAPEAPLEERREPLEAPEAPSR